MAKSKRVTSVEAGCREYVKTTATWQFIDDLIHLRKMMRWLPGSTSFAVVGLVVAVFISSLAGGKMFTVYAEIMRVKRIYMQERRDYLAELANQRRSSRGKAKR